MNKIEKLEKIKEKLNEIIKELDVIHDEIDRLDFEFISCKYNVIDDIKKAKFYVEDVVFEINIEIEQTKKYGDQ